jgi:hypothetical protein
MKKFPRCNECGRRHPPLKSVHPFPARMSACMVMRIFENIDAGHDLLRGIGRKMPLPKRRRVWCAPNS